jgi:serine-type D-Ala-D-Ala carboxypeptidase (penicillin-binding protein 5/6)
MSGTVWASGLGAEDSMSRRIVAVILLVVALCLLISVPVIAFTPVGTNLLEGLQATATPALTVPPFTPTPPPKPTPVLTAKGKPPAMTADEAILLDNDTGNILYDLNGEHPQPMASTTKIMTALIALQTADLNMMVTIHQDAENEVIQNNGSSARLVPGDSLSLKDVLYALLLPSGDDAAIAIADAVGGSQANFVNLMNLEAYRLHLFSTHYYNADGLTYYNAANQPLPGHFTTAYDLVRLARYAMQNALFAKIVATQSYTLAATGTHHTYKWANTNTLLKTYPGMTGIKTGFTLEAGACLVFSATRNGHHLIGVVMHSSDENHRFTDAKSLLDWGFALPMQVPTP